MCAGGNSCFKFYRLNDNHLKPFGFTRAEGVHILCHSWYKTDKVIAGTVDGKVLIFERGDFRQELVIKDVKNEITGALAEKNRLRQKFLEKVAGKTSPNQNSPGDPNQSPGSQKSPGKSPGGQTQSPGGGGPKQSTASQAPSPGSGKQSTAGQPQSPGSAKQSTAGQPESPGTAKQSTTGQPQPRGSGGPKQSTAGQPPSPGAAPKQSTASQKQSIAGQPQSPGHQSPGAQSPGKASTRGSQLQSMVRGSQMQFLKEALEEEEEQRKSETVLQILPPPPIPFLGEDEDFTKTSSKYTGEEITSVAAYSKGFAAAYGVGNVVIFEEQLTYTSPDDHYKQMYLIRIPHSTSESEDRIIKTLAVSPNEELLVASTLNCNVYVFQLSSVEIKVRFEILHNL